MYRTAAVAATLVAWASPLLAAQQAPLAMQTESLGPGLTVISGYTNGNILVLRGADGTLLVDAQSARRVAQADSVLAALGAPPVRWVLNTHYHGDHTEGNAYFRARGAEVIGQANLPDQMRKDTVIAAWRDWHRTPADPGAIPTETFETELTLRANGQRVVAVHVPSAHTDGDAIVWLPDANVIHTGDLFEHGAPPFIDWWAGGTIGGMLAGVDWILAHSDSATRLVPGHGPVGTRDQLLAYRSMLLGVASGVWTLQSAGASVAAVQAANPAAPWLDQLGTPRRADDYVALLYTGFAAYPPGTGAERLRAGTAEARVPWLLGCWRGGTGSRVITEQWSVRPDGALAGIGRIVRDGVLVNEEQVTLAAEGDRLTYTVRADGAPPVTFTSTGLTDSSVTFANPAHDFPTRVAYRRGAPSRLLAEIAGPGDNGEVVIPFRYAAVSCEAR